MGISNKVNQISKLSSFFLKTANEPAFDFDSPVEGVIEPPPGDWTITPMSDLNLWTELFHKAVKTVTEQSGPEFLSHTSLARKSINQQMQSWKAVGPYEKVIGNQTWLDLVKIPDPTAKTQDVVKTPTAPDLSEEKPVKNVYKDVIKLSGQLGSIIINKIPDIDKKTILRLCYKLSSAYFNRKIGTPKTEFEISLVETPTFIKNVEAIITAQSGSFPSDLLDFVKTLKSADEKTHPEKELLFDDAQRFTQTYLPLLINKIPADLTGAKKNKVISKMEILCYKLAKAYIGRIKHVRSPELEDELKKNPKFLRLVSTVAQTRGDITKPLVKFINVLVPATTIEEEDPPTIKIPEKKTTPKKTPKKTPKAEKAPPKPKKPSPKKNKTKKVSEPEFLTPWDVELDPYDL
ncbi:MAG: hypothetical protein WC942_09685 [Clostridia bacterium]|jgi:hypothetical protein